MLQLINANDVMIRQDSFYNVKGSYYYIKLKLSIARDVIFYANGGLIIQGVQHIPETLDTIQTLSRRYKIPKSSISRALINICDDGGFIRRVGSHGRGVKYTIILTPDKANKFIDYYSSTLQETKKSKKVNTRGIDAINGVNQALQKWNTIQSR